jgi:RIO kinase 1
VQGGIWVHREWETLCALSEAGVPVPRPIESTDRAILMSYIGDEEDAAPQLHRYRCRDQGEAEEILEQCLGAVERMLFHDVIHGDLSPFNVLVWEGRIWVIDLPQAVDPKKNRHAESLLARDVARVCEHFARRGASRDPARAAEDLWTAWTFADLVPEELRPLL